MTICKTKFSFQFSKFIDILRFFICRILVYDIFIYQQFFIYRKAFRFSSCSVTICDMNNK